MLLELYQFRCWKQKTFEFPDHGLVLLSGCSGVGKSTILNAIYFVLYGYGTKVITHGEKKCKVRFVFREFDMTRTKGPNRFTVTYQHQTYEDDVAQKLIDSHFGTNFPLTSYITQKMVNSFLGLTPSGKMEFLEKLMSNKDEIAEMKDRVKIHLRQIRDSLGKIVGKRECLEQEFSTMINPEPVPFPFRKKYSEKSIKNHRIRWENARKRIKKLDKQLDQVQTEFQQERIQRETQRALQAQHESLHTALKELKEEDQTISFDSSELSFLGSYLSFQRLQTTYSTLQHEYQTKTDLCLHMEKEEKNTRDTLVRELESKASVWESKVQSFPSQLDTDLENFQTLDDYLVQKRKLTEIETQFQHESHLYTQLCHQEKERIETSLSQLTHQLSLYSESLSSDISSHQKELKCVSKLVSLLSRLKPLLQEEETYSQTHDHTIKNEQALTNQISDLTHRIQILQQRKQVLCCPQCTASLRLDGSKLIKESLSPLGDEDANQQIQSMSQTLSESKTKLDTVRHTLVYHSMLKDQLSPLWKETSSLLLELDGSSSFSPDRFPTPDELSHLYKKYKTQEDSLGSMVETFIGKEKERTMLLRQKQNLETCLENIESLPSLVSKKKNLSVLSKSRLACQSQLDSDFEGVEESLHDIEQELKESGHLSSSQTLDLDQVRKLSSEYKVKQQQKMECVARLHDIQIQKQTLVSSPARSSVLCRLDRDLLKLKTDVLSLQTQLDTQKKSWMDLDPQSVYTPMYSSMSEDRLREQKTQLEIRKEKKNSLQLRIQHTNDSLHRISTEMSGLVLSNREFERELSELKTNKQEQIDIEKKCQDEQLCLQAYMVYKEQLDRYQEKESQIQTVQKEEKHEQRQLFLYELFLKKIKDTETIMVCQTCNNINIYMNEYLEKFFPDHPITVEIRPFKETKKEIKNCVDIFVSYKGETIDVETLSGGEYDRLVLAIMMALNAIFGSEILMLDESISSLDSELTHHVLHTLKNECLAQKLALIVSHQTEHGIFDQVVQLDPSKPE